MIFKCSNPNLLMHETLNEIKKLYNYFPFAVCLPICQNRDWETFLVSVQATEPGNWLLLFNN